MDSLMIGYKKLYLPKDQYAIPKDKNGEEGSSQNPHRERPNYIHWLEVIFFRTKIDHQC
jgi:hypothetical protein